MAGDLNSPTSRMTLPCVPNYSETLKSPNCMLGLPIGFTWGLNHTSKGTVTFPLRAPHGDWKQGLTYIPKVDLYEDSLVRSP